MLRKTAYFIINTISVLIILMAVFILLIVVLTKPGKTPQFGGYMVLRITTGSMEPAYPVDSLILVRKTSPQAVRKGDVISFYSSDPALSGAVNTHRVVAVEEGTDGVRFVTRGDANNTVDRYDVDASDLLGKVEGSSLILGKAVRLLSNPLIFVPIILLPLGIILFGNLIRTIVYARTIAREEEEAAVQEAIRQIRAQKKDVSGQSAAGSVPETSDKTNRKAKD